MKWDLSINIPTIIALASMLCAGVYGISTFETHAEAAQQSQRNDEIFARKDVNLQTTQDLKEWMERIDRKLEQIQQGQMQDQKP